MYTRQYYSKIPLLSTIEKIGISLYNDSCILGSCLATILVSGQNSTKKSLVLYLIFLKTVKNIWFQTRDKSLQLASLHCFFIFDYTIPYNQSFSFSLYPVPEWVEGTSLLVATVGRMDSKIIFLLLKTISITFINIFFQMRFSFQNKVFWKSTFKCCKFWPLRTDFSLIL